MFLMDVPTNEILRLNNFVIHYSLDYSSFSDDELILAHVICHNLFVKDKSHLLLLGSSHKVIVDEMSNRDFVHKRVDKLDDI